ncbi:MAG: Na+/H+ antiporter NhaC [Lachnospiraceae bacterium]|nr:Na+/H+ antiporter NhaC [Lachnospiraceae bacterium]
MKEKKTPSFFVAIFPILLLAVLIGVGFGIYRYSVEVFLLIATFITALIAMYYGTTWKEISDAISEKVGKAFMAVFIFVFVGMIIGTWMLSGTIPMLIYYGLKLLNPQLFLVSAFLITTIVSVCTGTSFGSMGTVGLALMGVAMGLGVNLAAAAGAVVSGAYFGDKMSPLSDTTNLAPVAAGCGLFEHIGHMFYTTIPASILCLIVYFIAGRSSSIVSATDTAASQAIMDGLSSMFNFNILLLIPLVIVLVCSFKGMPTVPVMFAASVAAVILAMIFQGSTLGEGITAAYSGYATSMCRQDTAEVADTVLTLVVRGGMTSMMTTVLKVLCAFTFAGVMTAAGFMEVILNTLKSFVHSDGTLILVTVIATIVVSIVAGNAYIPILLSGELFQEAFKERGLKSKNLSRVLEDAGTVVIPLVPWSAGGSYAASTLGVATMAYFPWAIFCYTGFLFDIILGFTGIGIAREEKA